MSIVMMQTNVKTPRADPFQGDRVAFPVASGDTMKAIVNTHYGSPDVLQLKEVAKPTPKDNEVLIKVHAAVVGPADCAFRKGDPFIVKLIYGLARPKFAILGVEFAGEIEAVGKDVTLFKKGDQ